MSSIRIQRVEIKAFKAFQKLEFNLNEQNLLAYGSNGSGKSSLYRAIYTFLQSPQRETETVTKYFDKDHPENLLYGKKP